MTQQERRWSRMVWVMACALLAAAHVIAAALLLSDLGGHTPMVWGGLLVVTAIAIYVFLHTRPDAPGRGRCGAALLVLGLTPIVLAGFTPGLVREWLGHAHDMQLYRGDDVLAIPPMAVIVVFCLYAAIGLPTRQWMRVTILLSAVLLGMIRLDSYTAEGTVLAGSWVRGGDAAEGIAAAMVIIGWLDYTQRNRRRFSAFALLAWAFKLFLFGGGIAFGFQYRLALLGCAGYVLVLMPHTLGIALLTPPPRDVE